MLLSFTMLTTLPEVGRGQCPDDSWTPQILPLVSVCPWSEIANMSYTIPGTHCVIHVDYCMREIPPNYTIQIYIYAVYPESEDCADIPISQLIQDAQVLVSEDPLANGNIIPPCSGGTFVHNTEVYLPTCWDLASSNPYDNVAGFNACFPASNWCEVTCSLCQNPDKTINRTCTGYRYSSEICGGGTMPSNSSNWSPGVCYDDGCTGD